MRKFIVLLLIAGVGYYLYTQQEIWRTSKALAGTPLFLGSPAAPTGTAPNLGSPDAPTDTAPQGLFAWFRRKPAALTGTALKEPFAWKVVSRNSAADPFNVSVEIMDGSRWRIEVKAQNSPKILVAVSDGSTAVSNTRSPASAATLDPHNLANIILTLAAKNAAVLQKISPQVTEQLDGHACWRTDVSFNKAKVRLWIDAHSHFPVCLDGNITGQHVEFHCSALQLDFAGRSAEFFNTHSTQPLFTNYLTP